MRRRAVIFCILGGKTAAVQWLPTLTTIKYPKQQRKKNLKYRQGEGTPIRGRPTKFAGESCVLSEKDRQVIKTTPARLWSRARQRLVETDHNSFLPSEQSRLHRKITKRNDYNEKTEISVNERNYAVN